MSSEQLNPLRAEVWLVNFNPTVGAEIRKARPAVVVSSNGLGRLPLRVVVPFTSSWRGDLNVNYWMVPIKASPLNGLNADTTADAFQLRSLSLERFVRRIGQLDAQVMEQVVAAVGIVVEL